MQSKTDKRNAAMARRIARKQRTNAQQLAILAARPGEAKREKQRLLA